MINIRKNCFETNSSSTHCLVIENKQFDNIDEDVFNKEYIITPFTGSIYRAEYTTIEDKLKYFLTIYHQGMPEHKSIMQMLSKMFPNVLFVHNFEFSYVFEDAEYYSDDFNPTEDELRDFMLHGTVYFGNRDDEEFCSFTNYELKKKSKFHCCWSG